MMPDSADPSNSPPSGSHASLTQGLEEAYLLMRYAASQGIQVEKKILDDIVKAKEGIMTQALSTADEVEFWQAFRELAGAVKPVSIKSIHAIDSQFSRPIRQFPIIWKKSNCTEAESASSRFRWLTFFAVCCLLLAQLYWLFGVGVLERNETVRDQIQAVEADGDIDALLDEQTVYANVLQIISFSKWLNPVLNPESGSGNDLSQMITRIVASDLYMRNILFFLSLFVLPLLYGLVGTCIYVVRELAHDIATVSYSSEKMLQYRMRLLLGTLAGLLMVWLLNVNSFIELLEAEEQLANFEDQEDIWKSMGPFALAFVTGYSVEIFFSALDRFVAAFSNKAQENPSTG